MDVKTAFLNGQEEVYMDRPFAGGQRAFSVQVKEVDIRTQTSFPSVVPQIP